MCKWEMVRLGDVCEIVSGSTPRTNNPELWDGGIKWVTPAELSEDSYFVYDTERHISEKASLKPMPAGTVLLSSRAPIGKVAITAEPMCCNQGFKNLVCSERVHNRYLYRWLKNQTVYLNSLGRGATFKEISKTIVEEVQIPLPPLATQQKIADILDRASTLIEKRKAQIAKLDLLVKSQFVEMFGDPVRNPMGWEVRKLGNVINGGPQNGLYKPANLYTANGTGTPILRIDAFYSGKITDVHKLKRLICTPKEIETYALHESDIVINRVNSLEYLGKCALITGLLEPTVFESNMMRFNVNPNILNALFVTTFLCSPYVYNQIIRHAKKAVNQASINQTDVQDFDILIPPLALQTQFANFVECVEAQKARMREGLGLMEMEYKALMQKCFEEEIG